jgi:catechol 2,3-dioxygenase-like lactoylglutathione lyase family enzyme
MSGSLSLDGLSHLTINVPDPAATNLFYQQAFGMDTQTYQAASPVMGVGPGVHFLMFIGSGRGGARINHACLSMENFDVERILGALEDHDITPRSGGPGGSGPLRHWVTMRMPNRGGVEGGTPELYFSDPDGLSIQLQDVGYCGGGGYLGEICP